MHGVFTCIMHSQYNVLYTLFGQKQLCTMHYWYLMHIFFLIKYSLSLSFRRQTRLSTTKMHALFMCIMQSEKQCTLYLAKNSHVQCTIDTWCTFCSLNTHCHCHPALAKNSYWTCTIDTWCSCTILRSRHSVFFCLDHLCACWYFWKSYRYYV
jgi:hypothetical protein